MRTSTFLASTVVLASAASTIAAPARLSKRGFVCAALDDDGGALLKAGTPDASQEVTCQYAKGGECVYFFGNGTFSSGSSTCPNSMVEGTDSSSTAVSTSTTDAEATTTTTSSSATAVTVTTTSTSSPVETSAPGTTTSAAETTPAITITSLSVGAATTGTGATISAGAATVTAPTSGALSLAPRTWSLGAAVFALWFML